MWVTLYGHTSPAEFEAFNTDREEADDEDLADVEERRNGHAAAMAGSSR
jgi:hypothetical protein